MNNASQVADAQTAKGDRRMTGPYEQGHWTAHGLKPHYHHLKQGERYIVSRPFTDYDGVNHPIGEQWRFLGYNYVPKHDGLSLFVSFDDQYEWHIRLCNIPEEQKDLIDTLDRYLAKVG
ncbi:DUF3601 domain-containing protein [Pantoea ananatis]|uniref:DUF3601 domain-containing protein n=1 Tax=Pantoea ananas TaxID=553 RepID=UPI002079D5AD|nr:DUF3601 domain-containing protein [Pantoea ananatis]USL57712.1 DUF3601 domain-containing protein [Pantoea ananatis]